MKREVSSPLLRLVPAVALALVLTGLIGCVGNSSALKGDIESLAGSIWLQTHGDWVSPPRDPDHAYRYRTVSAVLLYFSPDGSFTMLQCWIIENNKKYEISGGDGHGIFQGEWEASKAGIRVAHKLVYSVAKISGQEYPGELESAEVVFAGNKLLFEGNQFNRVTADKLRSSTIDQFTAPHRRQAKMALNQSFKQLTLKSPRQISAQEL